VSSVLTSVCSLAFEICLFTDAQQDAGNIVLHWFRIVKDKFVEIWNTIKHKFVAVWSDVKTEVMDACSCINFDCGCCAHLEEKKIELNSTSKTVVVT
jgi:hypothetical protein